MECLQYVVRATKKNCNSMIISGLMLKPQAAMNDVRMIQPLQSLQSLPGIKASGYVKENVSQGNSKDNDIRPILRYDDSLKESKQLLTTDILISEFDDDGSFAIAQIKLKWRTCTK